MGTWRQPRTPRLVSHRVPERRATAALPVSVPDRPKGASPADKEFAFPRERKEPLTDARHVRNAIARFDQVEGLSDAERDRAWKRILAAAKRYDVDVSASSWRDVAKGGKDRKR